MLSCFICGRKYKILQSDKYNLGIKFYCKKCDAKNLYNSNVKLVYVDFPWTNNQGFVQLDFLENTTTISLWKKEHTRFTINNIFPGKNLSLQKYIQKLQSYLIYL